MPTINLNGAQNDEPTIVELFDKTYRVRRVTRSVQKGLDALEDRMRALAADQDADGDAVISALAEGMDALLAIEGSHRTPASKLVMAKWNADELSVDQVEHYYEALQEAAAVRPT